MTWAKSIWGALAGLVVGSVAMADPLIRPLSREDVAAAKSAAVSARLSAYRVAARPAHMIRYPVAVETGTPSLRPVARDPFLPDTRWAHKDGSAVWTRAAMVSVGAYGDGLDSIVPRDIERWCPAYESNPPKLRRAFWVGMMSSLAKFESTYNPRAVGGGDLWYGLLQIYPPTARSYGCRARTGEALKNPAENLSCAARIMAVTVDRDQAVAIRDSRWRGVAADWGPMTKPGLIANMADWTRQQSYCLPQPGLTRPTARPDRDTMLASLRPMARPVTEARISTMGVASHQSN